MFKVGYGYVIHSSIGLREDFKKNILDYIKRSFGTQVSRASLETIPNVQLNHGSVWESS